MINIKQKKCKGTGKAKGYGCGKMVPVELYGEANRIYGIGKSCKCYNNWLLNSEEGNKTLKKAQSLGTKKAKIQVKKDFIKKKSESKSIASLIQEVRRPFQKLIRIRDHGKKCICCDKPLPFNIGDYDAGHCFKAELYTGLIFHPDNIHGQLVYCNKYNNGNENEYKEQLVNRIGLDKYNNLESIKNELKVYSWDRSRLNSMKKYYNSELKLVEKGIKYISEVDLTKGIV